MATGLHCITHENRKDRFGFYGIVNTEPLRDVYAGKAKDDDDDLDDDIEIEDIMSKLDDCHSPQEIEDMVIQVFEHWLGSSRELEVFHNIGYPLLEIKQQFNPAKQDTEEDDE